MALGAGVVLALVVTYVKPLQSVILPLCYRVRSHLIKPWVSHYELNALAQLRLQDVILHPHQ